MQSHGNDLLAWVTSASDTEMVGSSMGVCGITISQCGGGCFSWRVLKVALLLLAVIASKQASLTAPLKSPSSSFDDTCEASELIESIDCWLCLVIGLVD